MVHPYIVLSNIELRVGRRARYRLPYVRRHPPREPIGEAHLRPFTPAVARPLLHALGERRQREIQQDDERHLRAKQTPRQGRRRIVRPQQRTPPERRPHVELGPPPRLAPNLVEVPVNLLKSPLEP